MKVLSNSPRDLGIMVGMLRNENDRLLLVESEPLKYKLANIYDLTAEELVRVQPFHEFLSNRQMYKKYKLVIIQNAKQMLECMINEDQDVMAVSV